MRIIVDRMPEESDECLFSKYISKYGYYCILHNSIFSPKLLVLEMQKCNIENCPYLQEEKSHI